MIRSFKDKETEKLWESGKSKKIPSSILRVALRKFVMLDAAYDILDLRCPPGNNLEKLEDDRFGQWSIRINKQWRVCFVWKEHDAFEVEIVDYH